MKNEYIISLTQAQRYCFRGAFADLNEKLSKGKSAAVMAQVYPDGMRVMCVSGKKFKVIQAVLGGDTEKSSATLSEHIAKKYTEQELSDIAHETRHRYE